MAQPDRMGTKYPSLRSIKKNLEAYNGDDLAMYDRLKVDDAKMKAWSYPYNNYAGQEDPLGLGAL